MRPPFKLPASGAIGALPTDEEVALDLLDFTGVSLLPEELELSRTVGKEYSSPEGGAGVGRLRKMALLLDGLAGGDCCAEAR